MKCECIASFNNGYSINYDLCDHPAKFSVSFKSATKRGEYVVKKCCGKHKRMFQMNCNRIDKLMNENYTNFLATEL